MIVLAQMSSRDSAGIRGSEQGKTVYLSYTTRVKELRERTTASLGVYAQLINITSKYGTLSLKKPTTTTAGKSFFCNYHIHYESHKLFTALLYILCCSVVINGWHLILQFIGLHTPSKGCTTIYCDLVLSCI